MKQEVVKVQTNERHRGRGSAPYANVGYGRLSLSTMACSLIKDYEQYQYAELLKGRQNNKLCIGVRFLREEEKTPNALSIRRRMRNGIPNGGFDLNSKKILEELFGPTASASKFTRYNVAKDDENDNILIIFAE